MSPKSARELFVNKMVLAGSLLLAGAAWGQSSWFNVMGDAANPAVDTIEVDASPIADAAEAQTMRVRVSRAKPRDSWDGVPYRSYEAQVVFDCANRKARYSSIVFYRLPLWQGISHNTSTYSRDDPRWMLFRDVEPNPTERIIRAACESKRVKTGAVTGEDAAPVPVAIN